LLSDAYGPLVYGVFEASDFGVLLRSESAAARAPPVLPSPQPGDSIERRAALAVHAGDAELMAAGAHAHARKHDHARALSSSTQHTHAHAHTHTTAGPVAKGSVAAATVDVYGTQMAKLDLVTTREDVRRQGHARWGRASERVCGVWCVVCV
jgi:hypothetical protein